MAAAGPGVAHDANASELADHERHDRGGVDDQGAKAGSGAARYDDPGLRRAGSVVDMTPTLLALLGLPRGSDMDGRVMVGLLDRAFVDEHPLREAPTLTPDGWPATRKLAATDDDAGEKERIEQLRGLGYLH